ncbi:MAG: L-serine ammonia-lyase [Paludibacteraceae bacterium]|nr:L-serine ammonia-lyase [Paludibacteraceae bacterium]
MKSIREIFRIGYGPSSSHTMGPRKAAELFLAAHPNAARYQAHLYGSLSATGKGHLTDAAIIDVIPSVEIVWHEDFLPFHPNGMRFCAWDSQDNLLDDWTVYSVGGGALAEENQEPGTKNKDSLLSTLNSQLSTDIYPLTRLSEIKDYCEKMGWDYWEYVEHYEGKEIWDYLREVWQVMREAVERGLDHEGVLPGPLHLRRKAASYYIKVAAYRDNLRTRGLVFSYALAVSEENASGGKIVTAPTCGSCGVLPAVLYHTWRSRDFSETRILHALATAGLIGNVVKENASISGAEVGCQGEVGVACAMASAAVNQLFGGTLAQIEYAAEMGLEHHLGMTCDPVCGLVQIPCIERNAFAAARALDSNTYAAFSDGSHRVSFDKVVEVMKETGHDLPSLYKETSQGGLAKDYKS